MVKKSQVEVSPNWDMTKVGQARHNDEAYKMYYTHVMRGEKKLTGEVEEMSPEAFLKGSDTKNVNAEGMIEKIKAGHFISILFIDYVHGKKCGVKRAMACKELGIKEIPVLVCGKKPKKD